MLGSRISRIFRHEISKYFGGIFRCSSTANLPKLPENLRNARKTPLDYRHVYPEFVPDPEVSRRNPVREKLERHDMLQRRSHVDIPEFYVGTIMAVTISDQHAPGKTSRFLGVCIKREGCGLRAKFILRNVIDHQGVEVLYDIYDPVIQKVEIIKLEKRLDDELLYLRDALPEYSTFDSDMETQVLPEGAAVPINEVRVKLKPRPWLERWERKNLRGVQDLGLDERFYKRAEELATPWQKYDLMKEYRATVPEEEQSEIFAEIYSQLHDLELQRKKMKRKRTFIKPTKLA